MKVCNIRPEGLKVCKFIKKRLQTQVFSCDCEIFNSSFFIEHFRWLLLNSSYWTPPQVFYIFINVCKFFKFSTLESISQYANPSRAMLNHLCDICHGSGAREKQFSLTYQNWLFILFIYLFIYLFNIQGTFTIKYHVYNPWT